MGLGGEEFFLVTMGRVLLIGATGQLGTAMAKLLPSATAVPRSELDLGRLSYEQATDLIGSYSPDVVINCAAYTAVDRAETEEDLASFVNGTAVGILAQVTGERSIPFVTYSTDYVFPGTEGKPYVEADPVAPINAYGRSKALGEGLALRYNPQALVIRTSWVISGTHRNFVKMILEKALHADLRVVNDQFGCPTIAEDLARSSVQAFTAGLSGVLHLTNTGVTTWFELARASLVLAGMDPERVQPCLTAEFPTAAARPVYSVLNSDRVLASGLAPLPEWKDSLPSVVAALQLLRP